VAVQTVIDFDVHIYIYIYLFYINICNLLTNNSQWKQYHHASFARNLEVWAFYLVQCGSLRQPLFSFDYLNVVPVPSLLTPPFVSEMIF
jgi:hypothetical protein